MNRSTTVRTQVGQFRGLHTGKRCFVIGNGKTVNDLPMELLKNEVTFGANAVYLMGEKWGWLPTYHCVEDCLVAEDRHAEIEFIRGWLRQQGVDVTGLREPIKFYCRDQRELMGLGVNKIEVNFVRAHSSDGKPWPRFSMDCAQEVYWGGTVTYMSLQLAYYMGFSEVYMVGGFGGYKVPELKSGQVVIESGKDELDYNHCHPEYFARGKRWHDPKEDRMKTAYAMARTFFERGGRGLYDACAVHELQMLEHRDFEEVVGG